MIATYSEAHRRLNRVLEIFFVGCAAGALIGIFRDDRWVATVCLAAGFTTAVIRASVSRSAVTVSAPEKMSSPMSLPPMGTSLLSMNVSTSVRSRVSF